MNYSIIQKSQLESANRLDAEYYQPEYLRIRNILTNPKFNSKLLKDLILKPVLTGTTPKKRICKEDGTDIKFIKTDSLRDGEIKFKFADSLPIAESRKYSEPKENDVLVTIIGASFEIVGRTARVFEDDPKMNINQNIALIRPSNNINSSYLESFLRGEFGRSQLWQQSRQTEQVNLNCREVEKILIPLFDLPFQQKIDEIIKNSRLHKFTSIKYYKEAENFLLDELGLEDYKIEDDLSFVVNLSDVKTAGRADADYFQPKYEDLLKKLKKAVKLSSIAKRKINPVKIDPESEYNYIEISDINVGTGEVGYNQVLGKELPANARIKIDGDELIISKVRPTRGAISIIPNDWNNKFIGSGAFCVFKAPSPAKEYLQVVLRSIIGRLQMERPTTGTSYPIITDQDVESVLIPDLPKTTQQKISDLVRKSHEARKKSKELLEEAKRKVEEMIEKNSSF